MLASPNELLLLFLQLGHPFIFSTHVIVDVYDAFLVGQDFLLVLSNLLLDLVNVSLGFSLLLQELFVGFPLITLLKGAVDTLLL